MSLTFETGDIFKSSSEAIVNPVNTVGVMGKGLALMFKKKFPENFHAYKIACECGDLQIGKIFATKSPNHPSFCWIVNFPTKKHWRAKSEISWIELGLKDLKFFLLDNNIRSISIPALGSGLGGLNWPDVKNLMAKELSELQGIEVLVFEPR
ncbi:MAG: macro domain-containing protein [Litorimonas sp.]